MESEALTTDFSMTGAQLLTRFPMNDKLPVEMFLYVPNEDIEAYGNQDPIRLSSRIVWQRQEGQDSKCGVRYEKLSGGHRASREKCFAYFGKSSEF